MSDRRRRRLGAKKGDRSQAGGAEAEGQRLRFSEGELAGHTEGDTEAEKQRPRSAEDEATEAEITEAEMKQRFKSTEAVPAASSAKAAGPRPAVRGPENGREIREDERTFEKDKKAEGARSDAQGSGFGKERVGKVETKTLPARVVQELLSFSRSQFVFSEEFKSLEAALMSGPGLLDLFAGSRGLTKACCRGAPIWSLTFDITHSPSEDLFNVSLQNKLSGGGVLRNGGWTSVLVFFFGDHTSDSNFAAPGRCPVGFRFAGLQKRSRKSNAGVHTGHGNGLHRWLHLFPGREP